MIILLILIIANTKVSCRADSNVGSVLFYKRNTHECWNQDDLAKLRARKIFEKIVPPFQPLDKINTQYVKDTIRYFHRTMRVVDKDEDHLSAQILRDAIADTIGGHLRRELLPNARFAYYAGYIPYRSVRQLHNFYEDLKAQLNTQGLGWIPPEKTPLHSNLTVGKILIGAGKPFDSCACLVVKRDSNKCIYIPPPKVDDDRDPSALALPFKAGSFLSLTSPSSENMLLKYYTTAARCILRSSPDQCRHTDFVSFNNELWHWMKRYVAPHLLDEKLYAAYGGVLRIAAAVQNYGKGLARRNLYDNDYISDTKWHPLRALTNKQYYVDADWTPQLYIALVMGSALAICCLHICYNFIFGRNSACRCPGRQRSSYDQKEVAYAHVDSSFPAILPSHRIGPNALDQKRSSLSRSKSASAGTVRTQRVYDFNENAEKIMSIIMSDNEITEVESSTSLESGDDTGNRTASVQTHPKPSSPPKIDAHVAQIKIEKTPQSGSRQMYSTSTVTQSEVTYCQASDTAWTGSYTTDHTVSTASTRSRVQRPSRRSRDLAWARRVISKQTLHGKSTTGTEMDVNSYSTPPSRR